MTTNLKILCLLDVLGFENLFKTAGLMEIADRYEKLTKFVKEQTGGGLNIAPTPDGFVAVGYLEIGNAYFSDTLLFWTDYNKMSLPSFTDLISEAICFGLEHDLPLRGAISVGEAILDKNNDTYLGQPIIEATRTERNQNWLGASFGPSFSEIPFNQGFYLPTVLPYRSQYKEIKSPFIGQMVADWPRKWQETRKNDVKSIITGMDKDPQFSEYYKKSLAFVEFSEKNHDWFKRQNHLDYG